MVRVNCLIPRLKHDAAVGDRCVGKGEISRVERPVIVAVGGGCTSGNVGLSGLPAVPARPAGSGLEHSHDSMIRGDRIEGIGASRYAGVGAVNLDVIQDIPRTCAHGKCRRTACSHRNGA